MSRLSVRTWRLRPEVFCTGRRWTSDGRAQPPRAGWQDADPLRIDQPGDDPRVRFPRDLHVCRVDVLDPSPEPRGRPASRLADVDRGPYRRDRPPRLVEGARPDEEEPASPGCRAEERVMDGDFS